MFDTLQFCTQYLALLSDRLVAGDEEGIAEWKCFRDPTAVECIVWVCGRPTVDGGDPRSESSRG